MYFLIPTFSAWFRIFGAGCGRPWGKGKGSSSAHSSLAFDSHPRLLWIFPLPSCCARHQTPSTGMLSSSSLLFPWTRDPHLPFLLFPLPGAQLPSTWGLCCPSCLLLWCCWCSPPEVWGCSLTPSSPQEPPKRTGCHGRGGSLAQGRRTVPLLWWPESMGAELPSSPVVPITLEGLSCEVRGWGLGGVPATVVGGRGTKLGLA